MKKINLEELIREFTRKQSQGSKEGVHIGYFEDEGVEPSYDNARVCPLCNQSLIDSIQPVKTILIHCTRYPLATFMRFHIEELHGLMELKYHEVIAQALEQRVKIEGTRKTVPSIFRRAFEY